MKAQRPLVTFLLAITSSCSFDPAATDLEGPALGTIHPSDVQTATKELGVELRRLLPGRWRIDNMHQEPEHAPIGQVVFSDNGTFDLVAGSFAAIGMGSGGPQDLCQHQGTGRYRTFTADLAAFEHVNPPFGTVNSVLPIPVEIGINRIVFIGSGGCGEVGRQRISILTRQ